MAKFWEALSAASKGKVFQAKVAELYRLLGAETTENIEICGKKVDLLAVFTLPGGVGQHRTIVECKAEQTNRAQNQRVMEFCGLLEVARGSRKADSAEIVTISPWSEQAKGFAREAGIQVLTYDEKLSRLIDFGPYLRELIAGVSVAGPSEARPLNEPFVTIHGQLGDAVPVPDLLAYLADWANDSKAMTPHVVLGEYGSGKTSLCRMLAAALAKQFLEQPDRHRIPILLSLGDFTKRTRVEALISSFLDDTCGVTNPRFRLFEAMNRAGLFLLIMDGFDEMAARTDADTMDANLIEVEKLAREAQAKVMLTSRPEYFISRLEQQQAFSPDATKPLARQVRYNELSISPWSQSDIETFLRGRVATNSRHSWEFFRDRIADIPGLADLSRRPVLAEMIAQTLPALLADGHAITRVNLYEKYIQGELRRQRVHNRRHLLLSDDARIRLLQELAADAYVDATVPITFARAQERIRSLSDIALADVEPLARDFLSCSFLVRNGDTFRLSHKSIQEYLTARSLMTEIRSGQYRAFGRIPLDEAVLSFMREMDAETPLLRDTLLGCIRNSRYAHNARVPLLSGNAATVLTRIEPTALKHADLTRVSIRKADMRFAELTYANLAEASFDEVDFRCAALPTDGLVAPMRLNARLHVAIVANAALSSEELRQLAERAAELPSTGARKPSDPSPSGNRYHRSEFHTDSRHAYGYFDVTMASQPALMTTMEICRDNFHVRHVWVHETGDSSARKSWPEIYERLTSMIAVSCAVPVRA